MSGRVCYLARAERVEGPALVRLIGSGTDESWQRSAAPEDAQAVIAQTSQAANWVAQRAAQGDGPRNEIALLCVDVDGASCSWLTAPSPDPSVVVAVLAQNAGDFSASSGPWAPPTEAEAAVQALAAPAQPGRAKAAAIQPSKFAVAAVPDVDARLFVDALDDRGVVVERAVSLWHALALAWDPSARAGQDSEQIVASNAPVTASVLVEPTGRMLWAWSAGGQLLAAGSVRLLQERSDHEPLVSLAKADIARLTSDWLSWSVQLGLAPIRVICVAPPLAAEGGLTPAALGSAITKSWPGATVDMAVHDDPLGATLRRLASVADTGTTDDGRGALVSLSRRPGKAHRSLYRWAALAVFALAAALGALAWHSISAADRASKAQKAARAEMIEQVSKFAPPANDIQNDQINTATSAYVREVLGKRRAALNPNSGLEAPEPILSELETLSLIMGIKGVEIEEMNLLSSGVMIYVNVPDTRTGEDIVKSLNEIGTSHCDWAPPNFTSTAKGDRKRLTLMGKWKPQPGGKP